MEKKTYFMIPAHDSRCTIFSFLFRAQNGGAHEHEPGHESSPQICHCLLFEAASNHESRIVFLSLRVPNNNNRGPRRESLYPFIHKLPRSTSSEISKKKNDLLNSLFFPFSSRSFPFFALWMGCLSWILDSRTRVRKELL